MMVGGLRCAQSRKGLGSMSQQPYGDDSGGPTGPIGSSGPSGPVRAGGSGQWPGPGESASAGDPAGPGDFVEIGGFGQRGGTGRSGGSGRARHLLVAAGVGVAALLVGASVAYKVSGSGTSAHTVADPAASSSPAPSLHCSTSPSVTCSRIRGLPFHRGFAGVPGIGLGFMGGSSGIVHGQVVVVKPNNGGYETLDVQSGKITAVSPTSITVRSPDGYTASYTVASSTAVDAQRDGIGSVKVGNQVSLTATAGGSKATATSIIDLTFVEKGHGGAFSWNSPG
jgi:hypothetical protein